jgi:hypothetical protein
MRLGVRSGYRIRFMAVMLWIVGRVVDNHLTEVAVNVLVGMRAKRMMMFLHKPMAWVGAARIFSFSGA